MGSMGYTDKQANVSSYRIRTARATTSSAVSEVQADGSHLIHLLNQGITQLEKGHQVHTCQHRYSTGIYADTNCCNWL